MAGFGTSHADDRNAIGNQRRAGHGISIFDRCRLWRLGLPNLFAGLGVERDDMIVQQGAYYLAVVDGGAAIDDAAADDPQCLRRVVVVDAPDLLSRQDVDGNGGIMRGCIDNPVPDEREAFAAVIVRHGETPDRDQLIRVLLVDQGKRTIPVSRISHPIDEHVARCIGIVLQFVRGLCIGHDR